MTLASFQFNPVCVEPGSVFHYTKSNIDGSLVTYVCVYIVNETGFEVLKLEPRVHSGAYIKASMDWKTFSASWMQSWVVFPDQERRPVAEMSLAEGKLDVSIRGMNESLLIETYPVHIYNFDFISLNLTLPHIINPESGFSITVLQPTFQPGPLMEIKGSASILYIGDEAHQETPCRKYQISGEGMDDTDGWIWVNKQDGYIQNMEIPLADNPEWRDFKLTRNWKGRMFFEDWRKFVETEISKL